MASIEIRRSSSDDSAPATHEYIRPTHPEAILRRAL